MPLQKQLGVRTTCQIAVLGQVFGQRRRCPYDLYAICRVQPEVGGPALSAAKHPKPHFMVNKMCNQLPDNSFVVPLMRVHSTLG